MINQVILMGRLTKPPELRHTNSDTPVCSFTVAVDSGYGEKKKAEFINCVAWNKKAEFVSKYFQKGSMIAVCGRLSTRKWEGKNGTQYITEVIVNEVSFAGSRQESQESRQKPDEETQESQAEPDAFTMLDDDDLPF